MDGLSETELADLAATAYEAALDWPLWPSVIERLRGAFGAQAANVSGFNLARMDGFVLNAGSDPAMIESYVAHYVKVDPTPTVLKRSLALKQAFNRRALVPDATLVRTEYYSDWLRPQGIWHGLLAAAECGEGLSASITLTRERHQSDFDADESSALERLLPHIGRAIRTTARLAAAEARGAGVEGLLARLTDGALLLDASGALLYANPRAEALLRGGDGLILAQGRLCAARAGDTAALRRAMSAAAEGGGRTLAVARPSGRPALAVTVQAATAGRLSAGDPWRIAPVPAALVFVVEPDRDADRPDMSGTLRALYGLTAAEAAVAEATAQGQGVAEASAALDIAPSTVRWHLRRVFEKTGTARQAELARLVERLGPLAAHAQRPSSI